MIQKHICNKRIIIIYKVLIALIFILHSNIWGTLKAEEIESFRKRGKFTISASPLFGEKNKEGIEQSTNNNLGIKSHNYQYGRFSFDISLNLIDNLSVGLRYFETKNQKNSLECPNFPTIPPNIINYYNSYEYEIKYQQPSLETFVNYFPFNKNNIYFALLVGRTSGAIETYRKNNFDQVNKLVVDYPSSVKTTYDPMLYFGLGLGYKWKIFENIILDFAYDFKFPGKTRSYTVVNYDILLLALNPNSNSAYHISTSANNPSLTSVQSFYIRLGVYF
ncbi:hypothetical protein [Leptospira interrogans]|uniref:hypothetical protein n=1 Tax=Leptospira interrogans TaxID=173 RepID=UPI0007746CAC|nr:hypothetical protein [Leptospira interrogans]